MTKMRIWLLTVLILTGCSADRGYPLLSGGSIDLERPTGKLVLINYWAVWCAPCRKEIPELNAFAQHNTDRVLVLGVNFDQVESEQLAIQADRLGIDFPLLLGDPRALWGVETSGVLPETLVISPEGEFLQQLVGPQSLDSLNTLLETAFTQVSGR